METAMLDLEADGRTYHPQGPLTEGLPAVGLAEHIGYCVDRAGVTLLDTRRDRYFGLPLALESAFVELVDAGFRADPSTPAIRRLAELGILVEGQTAPQRTVPSAIRSWCDDSLSKGVAVDPLGVAWALWRADRRLKTQPLASTLDQLRLRRTASSCVDLARLRDEAEAFHRVRAWAPKKPVCLLDSIALLDVLHKHALHPSLVFGVIRRPFAAHCWVQVDEVVVNDRLDHVREYAPILVI
jgi:hypothetical protein